ncbi:MAG: nodulation protein NfeD, partial [Sulfurimonas sp.]|nr:nodulation protein NfeD [Sulfurimonas sp.]
MKRLLFLLFLIILPLFSATPTVMKFQINGAIGPATSSYLKEGMASAISYDVQLILIELDTPGGLSTSMREMIQEILNSSIPVATYVYPKGARAASAGTY